MCGSCRATKCPDSDDQTIPQHHPTAPGNAAARSLSGIHPPVGAAENIETQFCDQQHAAHHRAVYTIKLPYLRCPKQVQASCA
jgi:hypothetical protein